jgi:hypothetical protein
MKTVIAVLLMLVVVDACADGLPDLSGLDDINNRQITTDLASGSEWTTNDTYRQATFLVLDAADWAQTRNIARNPDKYFETNPSLGAHPTTSQVDKYFVGMALLNTGIAYALPTNYRAAFQYLSIGYEAGFVRRNLSIGIKVKF